MPVNGNTYQTVPQQSIPDAIAEMAVSMAIDGASPSAIAKAIKAVLRAAAWQEQQEAANDYT